MSGSPCVAGLPDADWIARALRAGRDASAWRVADLQRDTGWITALDDRDRADLVSVLRAGRVSVRPLLAYRRADFLFGERVLSRLRSAVD